MFYIGCPMWGYKEWMGSGPDKLFPPRTPSGDFLSIYSQKLNTVEGNTIFYNLPSHATITHWVNQTPATFHFCPKVTRTISHEGDLTTKKAELAVFVERMRTFGTRLGPIFLQLPATFSPTHLPQLATFLSLWPHDLRLAVEVRHSDFFIQPHHSTLVELLKQYNTSLVILDTRPMQIGTPQEQRKHQERERKPLLPVHIVTTTDFVIVRYIGHPELSQNDQLLHEWAVQIGQWLQKGITPYFFCHCPYEVHSPQLCAEVFQRVKRFFPLPPSSWLEKASEMPTANPAQLRLFEME